MVGSYTAMILGKILAGYLADKFNRRAVLYLAQLPALCFCQSLFSSILLTIFCIY